MWEALTAFEMVRRKLRLNLTKINNEEGSRANGAGKCGNLLVFSLPKANACKTKVYLVLYRRIYCWAYVVVVLGCAAGLLKLLTRFPILALLLVDFWRNWVL